jgi:hypothetical protein
LTTDGGVVTHDVKSQAALSLKAPYSGSRGCFGHGRYDCNGGLDATLAGSNIFGSHERNGGFAGKCISLEACVIRDCLAEFAHERLLHRLK